MKVRRREFLKLGAVTAGAVTAAAVPQPVQAAKASAKSCQAMLYDATRCIGCRACQTACKVRFDKPPTADEGGLYDQPTGLSPETPAIISMYQSSDGKRWSFMKRQCMHCLDPACASACLVKALHRTPTGSVIYDVDKCIGCRYCMIACPFDVPTFEFDKAIPSIVKCAFCNEFVSKGEMPRCISACPAGALQFGERDELIAEARKRIYDSPDRYVDHIYGEHEVGGTAALYIAGVSFGELGLPMDLPDGPLPDLTKGFLNSVPLVILLWAAFGTGLHRFTQRREEVAESEEVAVDDHGGGS